MSLGVFPSVLCGKFFRQIFLFNFVTSLIDKLKIQLYGLQQAFFIERDLRSTRDTYKEGVEEKETLYQVHRMEATHM